MHYEKQKRLTKRQLLGFCRSELENLNIDMANEYIYWCKWHADDKIARMSFKTCRKVAKRNTEPRSMRSCVLYICAKAAAERDDCLSTPEEILQYVSRPTRTHNVDNATYNDFLNLVQVALEHGLF